MGRTPQDITDKELEIMTVLWESSPATIRRITDVIYPDGGTGQYATIQKLLDRLEEKGFVDRRRATPANVYTALIGREELMRRRLEDMAAKLCDGSLTPLLTHLLQTRSLSSEDRRELRDLIDELDKDTP